MHDEFIILYKTYTKDRQLTGEEILEAAAFLVWLIKSCPTVYRIELINKGIVNWTTDKQAAHVFGMRQQGYKFWINQELIYRNFPALN